MNQHRLTNIKWHNKTAVEVLTFFVTNIELGLTASDVFKRSQKLGANKNLLVPEITAQFFRTTVIRDRKSQTIQCSNLVLGDIVFLEKNTMVPADIRLVEVDNLSVEQYLLNGDSAPTYKNNLSTPLDSEDFTKLKNMVYAGSFVLSGRAKGVVVAIGKFTKASVLGLNPATPKVSFRSKRRIQNLKNAGIFVQQPDILKQLKAVNTVIINLPLNTADYKDLIRVISTKLGKNIIICPAAGSAKQINETVPGIVHLDKNQFREKSNKALLEADYPLMCFDGVSQVEIVRYSKLLKLKNRLVFCIDSGQDTQVYNEGLATLTIADSAIDRSLLEADIVLANTSDKPHFLKQIDSILS